MSPRSLALATLLVVAALAASQAALAADRANLDQASRGIIIQNRTAWVGLNPQPEPPSRNPSGSISHTFDNGLLDLVQPPGRARLLNSPLRLPRMLQPMPASWSALLIT
jgi:hypothetical protein